MTQQERIIWVESTLRDALAKHPGQMLSTLLYETRLTRNVLENYPELIGTLLRLGARSDHVLFHDALMTGSSAIPAIIHAGYRPTNDELGRFLETRGISFDKTALLMQFLDVKYLGIIRNRKRLIEHAVYWGGEPSLLSFLLSSGLYFPSELREVVSYARQYVEKGYHGGQYYREIGRQLETHLRRIARPLSVVLGVMLPPDLVGYILTST